MTLSTLDLGPSLLMAIFLLILARRLFFFFTGIALAVPGTISVAFVLRRLGGRQIRVPGSLEALPHPVPDLSPELGSVLLLSLFAVVGCLAVVTLVECRLASPGLYAEARAPISR